VVVHDVAVLPADRVLVALGELGARVIGADGRLRAQFDAPAHRLVVAPHGGAAIAMARRGDRWRLTRLDLVGRRARYWCDARLDAFAPRFDGGRWFVGVDDDLLAIDVTAPAWSALWDARALGGAITNVDWDGRALAVMVGDAVAPPHRWVYDDATLRLRTRGEVAAPAPAARDDVEVALAECAHASGDGPLRVTLTFRDDDAITRLALVGGDRRIVLGSETGLAIGRARIDAFGRWAAVSLFEARGSRIAIAYLPSSRVVATVVLEGAARPVVRIGADLDVAVADDRGRVSVVDLRTGALRVDCRLGPHAGR
jgi:hypothetical protein